MSLRPAGILRCGGALRRRVGQEEGATVVVVAICMVVFLGFAALAIDLGSLYKAQRQAQSAADAGALAASQDLPASVTAAAADGTTYAITNYPGATATVSTPYNGSSLAVKVTVSSSTPTFFGKILGLGSGQVSASAVAANSVAASCTSAASGCFAIFAKDSSCTQSGVTLGGGTHINGAIHSNGSLNVGGGGSTFGDTTYGNGTGCTVSPTGYQSQNNTFASGPTPEASMVWPIDYSDDFPACSGSTCTGACDVSTTPCPAANQTPSFCTSATNSASETLQTYNPATLSSGNIYCDVGTGTASNPTTWNGAITVSGGPATATFVAGTVTLSGGDTLTACGYAAAGYTASSCSASVPKPASTNYPLVYAVGTGTSINDSAGGSSFHGDMFAPNGTIDVGGGTWTTFLEGLDVDAPGGGFTGDGPSDSSSALTGGGTESLLQ